jgi:hypothetical protein
MAAIKTATPFGVFIRETFIANRDGRYTRENDARYDSVVEWKKMSSSEKEM